MAGISYFLEMGAKALQYKLHRLGLFPVPKPLVITFSVTNQCNSRCKTCNIWKLYIDKPSLKDKELKLGEIEKIFKSIGHIYFFNISGGEPFLRQDLPEIVRLACKYLSPGVIHTPTNAIMTGLVVRQTRKIMEIIQEEAPGTPFTIKPSFDGVEAEHDKIRGVKGNFKKTIETTKKLKELKKEFPNLHVGLGTVVSVFNYDKLPKIAEYVRKLDVDSYINEIAEERSELFTVGSKITPDDKKYKEAIEFFKKEVKRGLKQKNRLTRMTQAFRLVYYDLVVDILKEKKQVIPCYAGLSNFHLTPYGDIWPCCVLGYRKSMGNLRELNYNFKKLWKSKSAKKVRRFIQDKSCACPLANQSYSNIMLDPKSALKVLKNMLF